ncbi:hypothetical protein BDV95DRAFT_608618 [Massariosphaeria phaeospora]|uniref:Uncharacterized protein n=1 Tax=Massariosphaeria phaeospora TaxID=100035 RepID=A0A7C8I890_9PLEO|nr:hypothetical protein BDV95DRAFT_608618 [Massariosphaeria phaeospora]
MHRKLKAIFHRQNPGGRELSPSPPTGHNRRTSEPKPDTAENHKETANSTNQHRRGVSDPVNAVSTDKVGPAAIDFAEPPSDSADPTIAANAVSKNETGPAAIDYAEPPSASVDPTIADDYRAYMPVLSQDDNSNDSRHQTLGGDRRLLDPAAVLKHSEDIADRNILKSNSTNVSTRTNSVDQGDLQSSEAARDSSTRTNSLAAVSSGRSGHSSIASMDKSAVNKAALRDRILPAIDDDEHNSPNQGRADWPIRVARDERKFGHRKQDQLSSPTDNNADMRPSRIPDSATPLRGSGTDGANDEHLASQLRGLVNLEDTVDVDRTVRWAPAVTHEVVKPVVRHVEQKHIYRTVHHYDVYHRMQPVYDTEILPARHFIRDPHTNDLVEVSEEVIKEQIPECTGINQAWALGLKDKPTSAASDSHIRLTAPEVVTDKTYPTGKGYDRRETTILHPPTLEDMSKYKGPVMAIHFNPDGSVIDRGPRPVDDLEYVPEAQPMVLKGPKEPMSDSSNLKAIPEERVPPRQSSRYNA